MLKAGFSRLDITPPLGLHINGYFVERIADHILDPLEVTAIALSDEKKTVILVTIDVIGVKATDCVTIRKMISEKCGIPIDAILLHATHIHTGPAVGKNGFFCDDPSYTDIFFKQVTSAAILAIADLKPASLRIGRNTAEGISFIRRFKMKDGSILTNPGRMNPNIDYPIGEPDENVQVVRFVRENQKDIVIVNFQVHPDVIAGTGYSADFPGFCRRTLEAAYENDILVAYFNGAQGDTNHVNVQRRDGFGYEHSKYMGRVIAGAVLKVLDRCEPCENEKVDFLAETFEIPLNVPDPFEVPWAENIMLLNSQGRQDELATGPMAAQTTLGRARRILELKDGPASWQMTFTAIRVGDVVFAGAPGEPFTWIGTEVKNASPFAMTVFCCCCNGYEGYFPVKSAFEEGGYESGASRFLPGVAELIAEDGKVTINDLFYN